MRIYTRSGDAGETSLIYGRRIAKDDIRVDAYGAVDEANSAIGVAVAVLKQQAQFDDLCTLLQRIQRDLFDVGRELATPEDKRAQAFIKQSDVEFAERAIDRLESSLPPLRQFILPGGTVEAAHLHQARTIVRRAERRVVSLHRTGLPLEMVVAFLNRLSDLLFVVARTVNHRLQIEEPIVDFDAPKPEEK